MGFKKYITTAKFEETNGLIMLTKKQAATRLGLRIKAIDVKSDEEYGLYEIEKPIEFKKGEIIYLQEEKINKRMLERLEHLEPEEEAKKESGQGIIEKMMGNVLSPEEKEEEIKPEEKAEAEKSAKGKKDKKIVDVTV